MKRTFDILFASLALFFLWPVIFVCLMLVYFQDFKNPFYVSDRVGKFKLIFKLYKIRSMIVNDNKLRIDTTSNNDPRITSFGKFLRKYKLDELPQLINVLRGDMSIVGPRPNVLREVNLYTEQELQLLTVRPGLSDYASIIFSNLGNLISGHENPNIAYNQLVRPWKGKLGCLYVNTNSLKYDLLIILATLISIFNLSRALSIVAFCLRQLNVEDDFQSILKVHKILVPLPPFGSCEIVVNRER